MDSTGNDLAGNTPGTALDLGTIASGATDTVTGFLDSNTVSPVDFQDWYSFTIDDDSEVVVELSGLANDASLILRDSAGSVLDLNRTAGTVDESLSMRLVAGTYIVEVGQFSGDSPISSTAYTIDLSVTAITDVQVAALYNEDGDRWNEGEALGTPVTISFSFMTALPSYHSGSNFVAFNDNQKAAARDALDAWADLANITFVESTDGNDVIMRFGTVTTGGSSTAGFAFFPVDEDANPNSVFLRAGDVFLSNDYGVHPTNEDPIPGEAGFGTLLHEIGHALGLKHPFEGADQLPANEENNQFSILSNTAHPEADEFDFTLTGGGGGASFASRPYDPETPMPADIEAIQFIYGTNTTTRSGDTVYAVADEESLMRTIYDAGGNDTIDLSATTVNQRLDLTPGSFSDINFPDGSDVPGFLQAEFAARQELGKDNLAIEAHTVIENAIGGSGDDTIAGNTADNSLNGGSGEDDLSGSTGNDILVGGSGNDALNGQGDNDTLSGGAGNDDINGGGGLDTVDYSSASGSVTVDLNDGGAQSVGGGEGVDTLSNIENLLGSAFGDLLLGDGTGNVVSGGDANDLLRGRGGDDELLGDAGDDNVLGHSGNDTLRGSSGDDLLDGRQDNDRLVGGSGNDHLIGDIGDDTLDGGSGIDTADYSGASGSVRVDARETGAQSIGGGEGIDILSGIENLIGSDFADILLGDTNDGTLIGGKAFDRLRGRGGNDVLDGGGNGDNLIGHSGDDTLIGGDGDDRMDGRQDNDLFIGGAGDDSLIGGDGIDTVDYSGAAGGVTVDLKLTNRQTIGGGEGDDRMREIENVLGSDFDDLLLGGNDDNLLRGNDGNDNLRGRSGNDTLLGGDGGDDLIGHNGDDTLDGGAGNDTLEGRQDSDILAGGAGNDLFVFGDGDGTDTITDFAAGSDRIDLSAVTAITDFADLIASHAANDGSGNMAITHGAETINLTGIEIADLSASDFIF